MLPPSLISLRLTCFYGLPELFMLSENDIGGRRADEEERIQVGPRRPATLAMHETHRYEG